MDAKHSDIGCCGNATLANSPRTTVWSWTACGGSRPERRTDGFRIDAIGGLARVCDGKRVNEPVVSTVLTAVNGDSALAGSIR
jgi:hypothetical protein